MTVGCNDTFTRRPGPVRRMVAGAALAAALALALPGLAQARLRLDSAQAQANTATTTTSTTAGTAAPVARGFIVKYRSAAVGTDPGAQVLRERTMSVAARQRVAYLNSRPSALPRVQVLNYHRWISADEARATAQRLRQDPDVEWVTPNYVERPMAPPTDPFYFSGSGGQASQWWAQDRSYTTGFSGIAQPGAANITAAWTYLETLGLGTGVKPVMVAVVDSGVRGDHPEFSGQLLPGYDFVSEYLYANDGNGLDADPTDPGDWVDAADQRNTTYFDPDRCPTTDSDWHGTFITGMVAAKKDNGIGLAGLAWPLQQANGGGAVVLPVRVAGKCGATISDIVEGMLWAGGIRYGVSPALNPYPARVVSLSFGGDGACEPIYQDAVDALAQAGVVVVAAAGNGVGTNGDAGATRPANCRNVLAVTALKRNGAKAQYANLINAGSQYWGVATVGGEGGELLRSTSNSGTTTPSGYTSSGYYAGDGAGTSYATPIAASVVAMMVAVNPTLSTQQLLALVTTEADVFPAAGGAACSSSNTGVCTCLTSNCGSGVLNAYDAVVAAQAATGALTGLPSGATAYPSGTYSSSFSPTRGRDGSSSGGGGGGGALQPLWLAGLGLIAGALARHGRSRRA